MSETNTNPEARDEEPTARKFLILAFQLRYDWDEKRATIEVDALLRLLDTGCWEIVSRQPAALPTPTLPPAGDDR